MLKDAKFKASQLINSDSIYYIDYSMCLSFINSLELLNKLHICLDHLVLCVWLIKPRCSKNHSHPWCVSLQNQVNRVMFHKSPVTDISPMTDISHVTDISPLTDISSHI